MNMKKVLLSVLVIFILAASFSGVSAEEFSNTIEKDINLYDYNIDDSGVITLASTNTHIVNSTYTNDEIQSTINNAFAGDTIKFEAGNYENVSLNVNKKLIFVGDGVGNTVLNSKNVKDATIFTVSAGNESIAGTSFYNMTFVITYTDIIGNGRSIFITNGKDTVIDSCSFIDGGNPIRLQRSVGNMTVSNSYFTGNHNASTIGSNLEEGTKSINVMGGNGINIINNTFNGAVLDGLSVASSASNVFVSGNQFLENIYGVYFGGGLVNITVVNNYFRANNQTSLDLRKSSTYSVITDNKFDLLEGNVAIYLEQGNTAHGAPTDIGAVYITDNEFNAYGGANPFSITAVSVVSLGGPLQVMDTLAVTNNTLTGGIKLFSFHDKLWDNEDGVVVVPEVVDTSLSALKTEVISRVGDTFDVLLTDEYGKILAGEQVQFLINGKWYNRTTDENGIAKMNINLNTNVYNITAKYNGKETANPITKVFEVNVITGNTRLISNTTVFTAKGQQYAVQILDALGNPLRDVTVQIAVNSVPYYKNVDENGIAYLTINLNPGTYSVATIFDGTFTHAASTGGTIIKVTWD
ncbi:right-handed parallel beta-helix repeat-containing protein [Methanobrevibacter sp. OttesenSCG-928-K11]|nr:right-handed parallel beta-helix repeat-containing protein [Methanobrevibacter sp. OttesenSCG-928-K11]MDL2270701.1 right-handed parallel beta-helix repeat-containing protein [Methanobrevibacter sp. OttesenSCG-928-I08]